MSTSRLHVVFLIYFFEPDLRTPDALLQRYSTIRPLAQAVHDEGTEVTVLQRFHEDVSFDEKGVRFEFHADRCAPNLRKWQIPYSFQFAVRDACMRSKSKQMAVHLHGLFYPLQMRLLRKMLPANCALVAQHHAEKPWQGLHSSLQRWGLCTADGFFFAARELADCWIDRGLISRKQSIFEVMEGSNHFRYQERRVSRARTGLTGTPMVLWVGNLTPNKDPLTVLDGFEKILMQVPAARLYMAYRSTELLAVVRDRIRSSSILYNAVTLMGSVDHDKLEDVYNSADFFVTGSHYEGSGFALAEAMACGVVPLVTAIPSFIAMTDKGRAGACWAAGDSDAFSRAFLEVLRKPVEDLSKRTLRFFDQQLSYPAIARASLRGYTELISARTETGE